MENPKQKWTSEEEDALLAQRIDVPQNFRKLLGSRFRRPIAQDKVDNHYRIKNNFRLKWTQSSLKDIRSRQSHSIAEHLTGETVEEAARCAAYKIAGAQNKSFKAAEAVEEAERIAVMAEESYSILQFAKDIFDKCTCGEVVLLA